VPINVDSVAVDFPELTLILAHAGMGLFEQATTVAVVHPNVYLELSYLQGYLKKAPAYFFRTLRNFIDLVSKEKILFGTDWPGAIVSHGMTMAEWVHQLKSLSESAKPFGIDFTQDEVDAIMGQNAARILKL
jgi:predicted TIM-barrel fold metal-dependent hydrolase